MLIGLDGANDGRRYTPGHEGIGTCMVADRDERLCGQDAAPGAPWPVCVQHALAVYRYVAQRITDTALDVPVLVHSIELDNHGNGGRRQPVRQDVMNGWPAVVYYVRIGDLIKIGTTVDLRTRMGAYPPGARLLAVEPGGEAVEQSRHRQFGHLHAARREWFKPGADLLEHIQGLATAGLPRAPMPRPPYRKRRGRKAHSAEAVPTGPVEAAVPVEPPVKLLAGDPCDSRAAAHDPDERPLIDSHRPARFAARGAPARILQNDHPGL